MRPLDLVQALIRLPAKRYHNMKKLNAAVVGLGFGNCFVDIYLKHPDIASLTICDANPERLREAGDRHPAARRVSSLDAVLADPEIDAVHLMSGIPDHARQSVAVLNAGKHCACTVPMATSIKDIRSIIAAVKSSGKNYMMMETQFYAREFIYACEMRDKGVFGHLQMLRGAHYQDMENWPPYWAGLPPMWYATHAIAPLLAFAGTRARAVHCFGSGFLRGELTKPYGNPYPMETAIFELERETPLAMEVTRALFHSARFYCESFNIYGDDAALEWHYYDESMILTRQTKLGELQGRPRDQAKERIGVPDYAGRLPAEISSFTGGIQDDGRGDHPSVKHGGAHGGSHPHLVHEFVCSIVERRKPVIDEIKAADWTAAGICAHESAMRKGARIEVPVF